MADIEKVIKGLERCCCHIVGMGCGNCPYEIEQKEEGIDECTTVLAYDALELLKEQEELLRKLQNDKDKLCLEVSEWKHKFHDRQIKEQDGIIPYIDIDEAECPDCKVKLTRQELIGDNVLYEDFFDFCPRCGKPVLWEGR